MTVLEAIQRSTDFLARKGVDTPRLQAELLLAHALGCERMRLYLNFEQSLSEAQANELRSLVQRRGRREPLQQIVGSTSFCGLPIQVSRDVLVPRPETELLAELGWQWLQAAESAPVWALDYGTGSGCIVVALAKRCPSSRFVAVDSSPRALAVARQNVELNAVLPQVELREADSLAGIALNGGFRLIVSNPPYIASSVIPSLQPEVRDFEPRAALDGGADGLAFYRLLARQAPPLLAPNGKLMVEFGDGQGPAVASLLHEQNWVVEPLVKDYSGRERIAVATRS